MLKFRQRLSDSLRAGLAWSRVSHLIRSGVECLRNSSHPLLKVTICSSSSRLPESRRRSEWHSNGWRRGDQFALLVSLSHIIADGFLS